MENFMEIIVRGFNFGDLSSYLQLALGQVTLDTLLGSFIEGLTTFFRTVFAWFA